MSTNVLEKIADHEQQLKAQAIDAYRNLVRDTEAGEDIQAADAMRILKDAGKSPADLSKAVSLIRQRRAWAEQAAKLKETEAALDALDREKESANEALAAAKEAWKAQYASITGRQQPLLSQHADCLRAADQLEHTSSDPTIVAIEREITAQTHNLAVQERSIRAVLSDRKDHLAKLKIKLGQARRTAAHWLRVPGIKTPGANVEAAEKEFAEFNRNAVEPLERQLSTIEQARAALNRESAKLAQRKATEL